VTCPLVTCHPVRIWLLDRAARSAGCEWLHVDFEDYLRPFYFGTSGFSPRSPAHRHDRPRTPPIQLPGAPGLRRPSRPVTAVGLDPAPTPAVRRGKLSRANAGVVMQIGEFGLLSQAIVYRRSRLSSGGDLSWTAGFRFPRNIFVPRGSCAVPPSSGGRARWQRTASSAIR
jgi:hypothetical protein